MLSGNGNADVPAGVEEGSRMNASRNVVKRRRSDDSMGSGEDNAGDDQDQERGGIGSSKSQLQIKPRHHKKAHLDLDAGELDTSAALNMKRKDKDRDGGDMMATFAEMPEKREIAGRRTIGRGDGNDTAVGVDKATALGSNKGKSVMRPNVFSSVSNQNQNNEDRNDGGGGGKKRNRDNEDGGNRNGMDGKDNQGREQGVMREKREKLDLDAIGEGAGGAGGGGGEERDLGVLLGEWRVWICVRSVALRRRLL